MEAWALEDIMVEDIFKDGFPRVLQLFKLQLVAFQ